MNSKSTNLHGRTCKAVIPWVPGMRIAAVMAVALLANGSVAASDNVLEEISYTTTGTRTDVVLQLSAPVEDARAFTTDNPPRIAIDLPNTRNGMAQRRVAIGSGAASSASAVEAGGRTRVVIDLFRASSYETRAEGNLLIVSIAGSAGGTMAGIAASDPAKAVGASDIEVTNIDFRRGPAGEGRILITFSGEGASTDLRRIGQRLAVDLAGVVLPDHFAERLDVTDFATPVQSLETQRRPNGARMEITINGDFEQMAYQAGNEFVVEIAPKRDEVVEGVGTPRPGDPVEYVGTRVTFNFQDVPVRSVLQLIAEESDLNIVVADSVGGNITLRLIQVPWDQALHIILRARSLDQRREGNVIWIAPQTEIAAYEQAIQDARIAMQQRVDLVTEYIQINYANAEEIAALLTDEAKTGRGAGQVGQQEDRGFLSSRGSVSFDRRTNTLLLNDTPEKVNEIKNLIAILDRAVDQVLIEARIVIASDSFRRELGARFGISGGYEDRHGNIFTSAATAAGTDRMANLALGNRLAGRGTGFPIGAPGAPGAGVLVPSLNDRLNVNLPIANPAGSVALAILGQDYMLDLELSALQVEGRGEIVSNPRVITANQQEASIKQGQEVGFVTVSPQQGGAIPIPNVEFKDVSLELIVTPTITRDGRVFLAMSVKKDEISGFVNTSIGDVPQVDTRQINTSVLVDDGQTVVLGGVYEFRTRDDFNKVPFLADLPAVGNLFKNRRRFNEKAELLIFVTPRVIPESQR
jgi:type IV pilus assembly protein PilQ